MSPPTGLGEINGWPRYYKHAAPTALPSIVLAKVLQKSDGAGMNFPQFWARGESGNFVVWRWSSQSLAEAQSLANDAVRQLAERFRRGQFPPKHHGYYPDRPFREQVLREIQNPQGEVSAVLTRNSYGCLVLNTSRVMFVDIDLPEPKRSGGFFKRLFGKPEPPPANTAQGQAIEKVESWTRSRPEWGWRIYRTRSGLRLLATHALFQADSAETDGVFQALDADPLYQKLCKSQKCFRARLTPKPWRCGINHMPGRWPWLDAKAEKHFQKWEAKYLAEAAEWATCELVRQVGPSEILPEVQTIVKIHDETTRAESKVKLA